MQHFKNLIVWQKSHEFVQEVYRISRDFPREELYGLTSQIRRAAVSVPSNIAEGCGRGTDGEFARFLNIAMGSAYEVEYQLLLARDLGYLDTMLHRALEAKITEIKKIMTGLQKSIQST
jgi:four helix bundle protein